MTEYTGQSWRLIPGNALDVLDGLPAGCARLVFADPPYNIGLDYGQGEQADRLPKERFGLVPAVDRGLCGQADAGRVFLVALQRRREPAPCHVPGIGRPAFSQLRQVG